MGKKDSIKKYFKNYGIPLFVWALIGGVIVTIGLFWNAFYWLVIGAIVLFVDLLYALYPFFQKSDSNNGVGQSIGCCGFLLIALVTVINIAYLGKRYITSESSEQHCYADCCDIVKSKDIIEVTRLEGFFHLSFKECKRCEQRKIAERKQQKANKKIEELRAEIAELQAEIELKEWQIDALRNGADVDDIDFGEEEDEVYYEEEDVDPPFLRYEP